MPPHRIHPSAIVSSECEISPDVEIGPYCIINGRVRLHSGVRLLSHVCLEGPTEIGPGTMIYPGACIGFPPQDVKFKPGMSSAGVKIGASCLIREHVTIHCASKPEEDAAGRHHPTTTGDRCFLMVNSHMGHDAKIGNDVVLVNAVLLAGHTEIGDKVTMGGAAVVHQFNRVGRLAFVSGLTAVSLDVPPFCMAATRNVLHGLNSVGLRRNGIPRDQITKMREAFREAFRVRQPRQSQLRVLEELGKDCPPIMEMAEFVRTSKRGIAPASGANDDEDDEK